MKTRKPTLFISMLFISIFMIKLSIAIMPVFSIFNSKAVNAVIMQLDQESKDEKDNIDKDAFKDKKFFDEDNDLVTHCYTITPIIVETNILHNLEHALFVQTYHPVVPTPPPNA